MQEKPEMCLVCKDDSQKPPLTTGMNYPIKEKTEVYYLIKDDEGNDAKIYYHARNFSMYFDVG
jgi:hypothetical protein